VITFKVDSEGGVDLEALLGDIELLGQRSAIRERNIYLDSWLVALITACRTLSHQTEAIVEILDEPYAIHLRRDGEGVTVLYGDQMTQFRSCTSFCSDLRLACRELLAQVWTGEKGEIPVALQPIQAWGSEADSPGAS